MFWTVSAWNGFALSPWLSEPKCPVPHHRSCCPKEIAVFPRLTTASVPRSCPRLVPSIPLVRGPATAPSAYPVINPASPTHPEARRISLPPGAVGNPSLFGRRGVPSCALIGPLPPVSQCLRAPSEKTYCACTFSNGWSIVGGLSSALLRSHPRSEEHT